MSGSFRYAEGWTRHLHLGYCDEDADPLVEDLPATHFKLIRSRDIMVSHTDDKDGRG